MKTPMQELIDRLNNVKPTDFCSIETIKGWAESMLEKEKEQMRLVHKNGYDNSQYRHDCKYGGVEYWDNVPKPFEEYYNETFNTNEK
jgi:hypothetical protein